VVSPIVSYRYLASSEPSTVVSPVVAYQYFESASSLFTVSPIVSFLLPVPGVEEQPMPGSNVVPLVEDLLGHLWVWNESEQQFEPPDPPGVINLNSDEPTYLLTHGWEGDLSGETCCGDPAMSSIACAIRAARPSANLLAWDWRLQANPNYAADPETGCDVPCPGDLPSLGCLGTLLFNASPSNCPPMADAVDAANAAGEQGQRLGEALAKQLMNPMYGSLGSELHFIGKSHGGGLLGQAARALKQNFPAGAVNSLTTLDTPRAFPSWQCDTPLDCTTDYYVDTLRFVDPLAVAPDGRVAVWYYPDYPQPDPTGFGQPVTGCYSTLTNLALFYHPTGTIAHLWIAGSDDADGPCPAPFSDGWFPAGVWDPDTMAPHPVLFPNQTVLSPLYAQAFPTGNFEQHVQAGFYTFNEMPCPAPGLDGSPAERQVFSLVAHERFVTAASWFGSQAQLVVEADPDDCANRVMLLTEQGDASFFKDIEWPANALEISFRYMFREPRGGESLTVHLNDEVIYYDAAEISLATEHLTSSGPISIGQAAGSTATLTFVLRTDGTFGGSLVLDDVKVFAFVPGDIQLDGDVDLLDAAVFQRCAGSMPQNECNAFDFDQSQDVGLSDYAILHANLTGPMSPPPP